MQQPGAPDQDELSQDDLLEARAEERRRVVAAFMLGSEASQSRPRPRPLIPQFAGLGIALAVATGMGLVGIVQQQIRSGQNPAGTSTPAPISSPVIQTSVTVSPLPATSAIQPTTLASTPSIRPPTTRPPRPTATP
jgi:hypothetical protein